MIIVFLQRLEKLRIGLIRRLQKAKEVERLWNLKKLSSVLESKKKEEKR